MCGGCRIEQLGRRGSYGSELLRGILRTAAMPAGCCRPRALRNRGHHGERLVRTMKGLTRYPKRYPAQMGRVFFSPKRLISLVPAEGLEPPTP